MQQLLKSQTQFDDKRFLEKEIALWRNSSARLVQIQGEQYYNGIHDILEYRRTVIGEGGRLQEVENLPNFHVIDNQYAKMVDQKVNYLLGKPPTFDTEDKKLDKGLREIFGGRFYRTLRGIGEASLNGGIGWIYIYYDNNGKLSFKRFEAYEILPFWSDAEHTTLDAALRLYEREEYEGEICQVAEYAELYTNKGVYRYRLKNGTLTPEKCFYMPYLTLETKIKTCLSWGRIPLVAFKYNSKETPLITRVKSLQDGINLIISAFQNNMMEDARSSILVLVNYDGENLGEFRRNLAAYGAVKVRSTEGAPGGDLRSIGVQVNCENYRVILKLFKEALIENARGYDAKDSRLTGNPNQMNLLSMYNDIDLDASGMESEYQASFEELLWFVRAQFRTQNSGNDKAPIEVVFNRSTLINNTEMIAQCTASTQLVSKRTLMAHHPFVKDVEKELAQLEAESEIENNNNYIEISQSELNDNQEKPICFGNSQNDQDKK